MSLRFFRQAAMFVGVVGGTLAGYSAGASLSQTGHMLCAFAGMAAGGAFVHLCIHGDRR